MPGPIGVAVTRGNRSESAHVADAVLHRADGTSETWGSPSSTYLRSAAKPLQAMAVVLSGAPAALRLAPEHIAVISASHNAEPGHVGAVREVLQRAGVDEAALRCGTHLPYTIDLARTIREPRPVHNNCSGKHAGMLAACAHGHEALDTYLEPTHPLQRRIRGLVGRATGCAEPDLGEGVDGCGTPTFSVPLSGAARAYQGLAGGFGDPALDAAAGQVLDSIAAAPFHVAGTGRLCTDLASATGGTVIGKAGAEGVYCSLNRQTREGLAVKARDGAKRAAEAAASTLMLRLGWLDEKAGQALQRHIRPVVRNHAGLEVGRVEVRLG